MRKSWSPLLKALADQAEPVTAQWVAERIDHPHPDSVLRSLQTMAGKGYVQSEANGRGKQKPGWRLMPKGREAVTAADAAPRAKSRVRKRASNGDGDGDGRAARPNSPPVDVGSGNFRAHQQFVTARLSSTEVPDLLELLADAQASAASATVARLDGDEHNYMFLFDGERPARSVEALSVLLRRRRLPFSLGTIAEVRTMADFLADSRHATRAAARTPQGARPLGGRGAS